MVTAIDRDPSAGLTRTTRLPVRSVIQRYPSGPHDTSQGPARLSVTTRDVNVSGPNVVTTRGLADAGTCAWNVSAAKTVRVSTGSPIAATRLYLTEDLHCSP